MIEVEVKIVVDNSLKIENELNEEGFKKAELVRETDIYFDNKEGSFRKGDKALRIRQYENFASNETISCITYKGPKLDSISMTRKEIEMRIEDVAVGKEILEELGFLPVRPVVKLRQYFQKEKMTACLDQVEGLGDFLELEMIVDGDGEIEAALAEIVKMLNVLGYEKEDIIRTSYLSMLQRK